VEEVGHFVGSLEHFVRDYGAAAVTVILALEALGAPLPGETLLIFASVLAGRGDMSLPALLIFAWAGSVLGDNIGYAIGRRLGRAAITRYGARVGLTASRFDAVERVFARYCAAARLAQGSRGTDTTTSGSPSEALGAPSPGAGA
jgi:membrane protein DedA with SNARE-associated domain